MKCQGLKCKQFDIYRMDPDCPFECTCLVTDNKTILSQRELNNDNDIECPEGAFDPVTPNKCRGIFCRNFTVYDDGKGYPYNCKCEKSGHWVDLWEDDLSKENELDCPKNGFEPADETSYPPPIDID